MLRVLAFLVVLGGMATGLAWFADRPGTLTVEWLDYEITTSVFASIAALIVVVALILLAAWLVARLWTAPARMARRARERRRQRSLIALRRGFYAVGSGDTDAALSHASTAQRTAPNEPLTKLLRAEAARSAGDRATARRIFEAMTDAPETRPMGLRGLYIEATAEGESDAARQYAQRALAENRSLGWSIDALLALQLRDGDWSGALDTLGMARAARRIPRGEADRKRAVLLTAEAQRQERTRPAEALDAALEAHRLAPGLIPAAVIAGRLYAAQGHTGKAARIVARCWLLAPHPDLATVYAFARPGDSPRDRLMRIRTLAALAPDDEESRLALAGAACDAQEWDTVRSALEPLTHGQPSARVCMLMARLEGGANRDAGRVREWLARAVGAPRGKAWVAGGVVASEWAPVSATTGELDAFEWIEAPPVSLADGAMTDFEREIAAQPVFVAPPDVMPGGTAVLAPERAGGHSAEPTVFALATRQRPREPAIFVPTRAPDDPGPDDASDADDLGMPRRRLGAPEH